jgi:AcrR family transcriptional regulator
VTTEERRTRERDARRRLITSTARLLAEREGWEAVTTRRLSTEIEYSQPVIYKHFSSMEDLIEAIALEGFAELAEALGGARHERPAPEAVGAVAHAYVRYASENPAVYSAMFDRATGLRFDHDSPTPLRAAFAELRAAAFPPAGGEHLDTLTEVLWAGLHGLVALGRTGRLVPGLETERIDLLVSQFATVGL